MKEISLIGGSIVCYTAKEDKKHIIVTGHFPTEAIVLEVGDIFIDCPFSKFLNSKLKIKDISFKEHKIGKYAYLFTFYTAVCNLLK